MGGGRGGLHKGTWGSREGEGVRRKVREALERAGGSVAGDAAAELAEDLARIASGESPEDVVPRPGEVAFDLALDALSAHLPGGGQTARVLSAASKRGGSANHARNVVAKPVQGSARAPRQLWLEQSEYAMVMPALNNMHHTRLKGKSREYVSIGNHAYEVVIQDFNEYIITDKWRLE